jgi:hypothetical protein
MNKFKKKFRHKRILSNSLWKKLDVKSDLDQYSPKLEIKFSWQLLHRQYWLFMLILNI